MFYFCLIDGFEKKPKRKGKNCPLDKYGLSMIAVSVTEDGEPNTITCRWNHDNGGNDNIMTKDQIEELLGVNFYETFKPYSAEEIANKKEEIMRPFREAKMRLEQGESPRKIFYHIGEMVEGFAAVAFNKKYSFIDSNNKLIGNGESWFDWVDYFKDGFAPVRLNNKYSFINTTGELIGNGNAWFDSIRDFKDGFAQVELNGQRSLINTKGELIGNGKLWFDYVSAFKDGFAQVELNDKYSFINTKGELIGNGKAWFDGVGGFKDGFAIVRLYGKGCSFINTKGYLIGNGKLWFDKVDSFDKGFARVKLNNKYSFLNAKGELIGNGKAWFDEVYDFGDGFAQVKLNKKWTFINTKGELIGNGNVWFDNIRDFKDGFAQVELNDKWSLINTKGELIGNGKLWFDWVYDFRDELAQVMIKMDYYYIDKDGNFYDIHTKQPIPNPLKENKRRVKTIVMSESKLHNILLELDWKTYGNAMLKSKRLANSLPKNDINRYINDKRSKNFALQFDNDLLKQYNLDPLEYDNAMTWISSNGDAGYEPDLNVLKRVKMVNKESDMLATNRYKYIKGKGWTNIDNL